MLMHSCKAGNLGKLGEDAFVGALGTPWCELNLWCVKNTNTIRYLSLTFALFTVQVRGKDIPKPVRSWNQCGLATRVLEILRKAGYEKPLPIQAQALPVIMSGRDCIGIAKTGSGKTLAFVLPMLRHIKDQVGACLAWPCSAARR